MPKNNFEEEVNKMVEESNNDSPDLNKGSQPKELSDYETFKSIHYTPQKYGRDNYVEGEEEEMWNKLSEHFDLPKYEQNKYSFGVNDKDKTVELFKRGELDGNGFGGYKTKPESLGMLKRKEMVDEVKPEQPKMEMKQPKLEQPKMEVKQETKVESLTPDKSAEKYFNKPMKQSSWDENVFETDDGEEYLVVDENKAYDYAKDEIKSVFDDLGLESFTDNFREWILANAVDEDFVDRVLDEEIDFYEGEGEDDMVEYVKDVKEKGEGLDYLKELYGERDFSKWLEEHNAIDLDKVADEAISWDGLAHFLSSYDGKEHDLGNGLYAYRRN